jgi:hypothetical protein
MRGVALVRGLGAAFILDDASVTMTASAPLPTRIKTGWRCLLLVAVVVLGVVSAALVCAQRVPLAIAVGGLTAEVFAFVAVTAASALVLQRRWGIDEPGQFAGLGVVGTYLGAFILSSRWPMLVGPGPDWSEAHARWLVVGVVATVIAAIQLRDPASRGIYVRRARSQPAKSAGGQLYPS